MQIEKSKRVISNLIEVADSVIRNFYLAATSGYISNKMACIEFSFEMLYESSRMYNVIPKDSVFMSTVNSAMQKMTYDVASIEYVFGVLFSAVQQYRLILTSWMEELNQCRE